MYTNCAESAEEADSQEQLEFDDKQYPQLPDNVLEMQPSLSESHSKTVYGSSETYVLSHSISDDVY